MKSAKHKEADAAKEKVRGRMGAPDVATALLRSVVMSALGAGEEQYTNLPGPKTYKASLDSPDAHLWAQARSEERGDQLAGVEQDLGGSQARKAHACAAQQVGPQKEDGR